ncbi:MAG TPA: hypothetical protein PLT15_04225 [Bacilli bacterium]|nr:hypothetical protein [Bacilli bacterium]HQD92801.1 hypothetical protein [Bacilli bacterium]
MKKLSKFDKFDLLLWGLGLIIVGVLFVTISEKTLLKFLYIVIGLSAILISVKPLILSAKNLKFVQNYFIFATSLVLVILGIMMLIIPSALINSLIVIFLLISPLVNIFISPFPIIQFQLELPKITFGLIFLLVGFEKFISLFINIGGILSIILGVLCLVLVVKEKYF